MLGLQTKLNGMTQMVMVVEIIHEEPLLMFVQMFQEPLSVQLPAVTVGVAKILMGMDGLTKEISSNMNHRNGETKMEMDLETIQMDTREILVQMNAVNHFSTG